MFLIRSSDRLSGSADRRFALVLFEAFGIVALVLAATGIYGLLLGSVVTLLYGVSPLDPLTYGGVSALLIGIAAIACSVSARRAAWIDPATTLRAE